ncbi:hypothetical protein M407DRAFT_244894 [Tulasnella calospora MUT 4182]|uniref:Essential protein Yae1 N-terminal domain-containing protein n=1 Tax=Tulasnella calospora MUT 4182 TaxID=1051891 RepID=A0A0C3QDY5_9AGAM|nr:hypothetical protein M407DRAFT_244894 [Tulasnella calospora MUT 4182]
MNSPLDDLSNLEQSFYNSGYEDGFSHGRVHGLIEGRALGKEKGFGIWEEVGFYRGFALFWAAVIKSGHPVDEKRSRALRHASQLLEIISTYPRQNPSHLIQSSHSQGDSIQSESQVSPLDLTKIRSKYRLLCASLNVSPRPSNSSSSAATTAAISQVSSGSNEPELQMAYEEDQHPRFRSTGQSVNPIWRLD